MGNITGERSVEIDAPIQRVFDIASDIENAAIDEFLAVGCRRRVLYLHGAGGAGKSTLLREAVRRGTASSPSASSRRCPRAMTGMRSSRLGWRYGQICRA